MVGEVDIATIITACAAPSITVRSWRLPALERDALGA
jgi:hypothetical protein